MILSYIKLLVSATVQGENGTPSEPLLGSETGRRSYTLLQGHAGPVYSATFSPLGDFILSSSSDSTSMSFVALLTGLKYFHFGIVLKATRLCDI